MRTSTRLLGVLCAALAASLAMACSDEARQGASATPRSEQRIASADDEALDNLRVTRQIREELLTSGALSPDARNISIVTTGESVTLVGTVAGEPERRQVIAAVERVAGQRRIEDGLEIATP